MYAVRILTPTQHILVLRYFYITNNITKYKELIIIHILLGYYAIPTRYTSTSQYAYIKVV